MSRSLATFSMTEVGRRLGDVKRSAQSAPVVLTTRGKADLVVLTAETYDALTRYQPVPAYAHELDPAELALIGAQEPGAGPMPYPTPGETKR